jgi:hypothetical protein
MTGRGVKEREREKNSRERITQKALLRIEGEPNDIA